MWGTVVNCDEDGGGDGDGDGDGGGTGGTGRSRGFGGSSSMSSESSFLSPRERLFDRVTTIRSQRMGERYHFTGIG